MGSMRIAVPVREGMLCGDVSSCEAFAFVDVDRETRGITGERLLVAPPRQHGELPSWLAQMGASLVIAESLSTGTRDLCHYHGISVLLGAPRLSPAELVNAYLNGGLPQSR